MSTDVIFVHSPNSVVSPVLTTATLVNEDVPMVTTPTITTLGCVSPCSIHAILNGNSNLDAACLHGIAKSLVATLATQEQAHKQKEDELEAHISELETEVHFWSGEKEVSPEGYVINGNRVTVGIPIGEGLSV
jgi:hypothetical protein